VLQLDGSVIGWNLPVGNLWMCNWYFNKGGRLGPPSYGYGTAVDDFFWAFDYTDGSGQPVDWSKFVP